MDNRKKQIEAKKIFEEWQQARQQIEEAVKKYGKWSVLGLDSNAHLFKQLDEETKKKLDALNKK